ncbi:hypothetical protein NYE25_19640 [Paenibacillus sp. FSL E2-8871]|uniref:hypothetical protein n=1 Tax=Paenibacillus TaxID=44249 RepID=UPI000FB85A60|nr:MULTISPECIES: hypothetical protein [Paenibacillus]WHY17825.1 hypothetical protein QNH28_20270 [Paenibacillus sp. G2S3]WHY21799.1 hypothetical protein QNH28_12795 [Paenibacillus sp. G2S3]WHY22079.1 hypothetical protein QNH28_14295 [Paenibacillus sp. G2S3]
MKQIDGEEDSVLTWGDLYGTRNNFRNLTCEGKLNVQKSADAIVRPVVQHGRKG